MQGMKTMMKQSGLWSSLGTHGSLVVKITQQIDNEWDTKTKVKHWRERRQTTKIGVRPEYVDKLNENNAMP